MDDVLLDGYRLKKRGCENVTFYLGFVMVRMPYIWGKYAKEFRPENMARQWNFST